MPGRGGEKNSPRALRSKEENSRPKRLCEQRKKRKRIGRVLSGSGKTQPASDAVRERKRKGCPRPEGSIS